MYFAVLIVFVCMCACNILSVDFDSVFNLVQQGNIYSAKTFQPLDKSTRWFVFKFATILWLIVGPNIMKTCQDFHSFKAFSTEDVLQDAVYGTPLPDNSYHCHIAFVWQTNTDSGNMYGHFNPMFTCCGDDEGSLKLPCKANISKANEPTIRTDSALSHHSSPATPSPPSTTTVTDQQSTPQSPQAEAVSTAEQQNSLVAASNTASLAKAYCKNDVVKKGCKKDCEKICCQKTLYDLPAVVVHIRKCDFQPSKQSNAPMIQSNLHDAFKGSLAHAVAPSSDLAPAATTAQHSAPLAEAEGTDERHQATAAPPNTPSSAEASCTKQVATHEAGEQHTMLEPPADPGSPAQPEPQQHEQPAFTEASPKDLAPAATTAQHSAPLAEAEGTDERHQATAAPPNTPSSAEASCTKQVATHEAGEQHTMLEPPADPGSPAQPEPQQHEQPAFTEASPKDLAPAATTAQHSAPLAEAEGTDERHQATAAPPNTPSSAEASCTKQVATHEAGEQHTMLEPPADPGSPAQPEPQQHEQPAFTEASPKDLAPAATTAQHSAPLAEAEVTDERHQATAAPPNTPSSAEASCTKQVATHEAGWQHTMLEPPADPGSSSEEYCKDYCRLARVVANIANFKQSKSFTSSDTTDEEAAYTEEDSKTNGDNSPKSSCTSEDNNESAIAVQIDEQHANQNNDDDNESTGDDDNDHEIRIVKLGAGDIATLLSSKDDKDDSECDILVSWTNKKINGIIYVCETGNACKLLGKACLVHQKAVEHVSALRAYNAFREAGKDQQTAWKNRITQSHKPLYAWRLSMVERFAVPMSISMSEKHKRNRCFTLQSNQLGSFVERSPPDMCYESTCEWFVNSLCPDDFQRLSDTVRHLHGCRLKVGTTCSGTDIAIPVIKGTMSYLSRRFKASCT